MQPDGVECVGARWLTPRTALHAHERGELPLVLPTHEHLEQLSAFATTHHLMSYAGGREVRAVQPRVVLDGESAQVLPPDDYDGGAG